MFLYRDISDDSFKKCIKVIRYMIKQTSYSFKFTQMTLFTGFLGENFESFLNLTIYLKIIALLVSK